MRASWREWTARTGWFGLGGRAGVYGFLVGDLLDDAGISWAWYGGAWNAALSSSTDRTTRVIYGPDRTTPNFQPHHQPFNYFADLAPGTAKRGQHLLDGGIDGAEFVKAVDAGTLPQVAFYKPQGNLTEHPGYADVAAGDGHIAEIIEHLERSPQWPHMVVIVTTRTAASGITPRRQRAIASVTT